MINTYGFAKEQGSAALQTAGARLAWRYCSREENHGDIFQISVRVDLLGHIATVRNYVVEGHVPADVVKDMLKKRPEIEGIAVPGMPAGSPGMESQYPQPYEVVAFTKAGKTWVFAKR